MSISAEKKKFHGKDIVELTCGRYTATIAAFNGSNIMRMQDTENGIDFFRNDPSFNADDYKSHAEIYGFPTLYLPNRLSNGTLKVSDYTYHFPCNDPLGNHIHGFLHLREHTVTAAETTDSAAICKTEYVYDENDPFFETFPVSFKAEFIFTLSDEGMSYSFTMTNLSDRFLPYGVCNHTAMKGPFTENGRTEDVRLYVPIGDKVILNSKCIPDGTFKKHDDYDKAYIEGTVVPVGRDIDNDMYFMTDGNVDGKPFYGIVAKDTASNKEIRYEVCRDFKYWVIWNDHGDKGYFCPEPMSWIIDAPNLDMDPEVSGYTELAPGESKTMTEKIYSVIS
ncbi:aldose 1-epimerase [Eubacterium ruminantium]|uniref:aldose 1-epimerase n=1 Tax=Eubacterium ruminantium TaxID=42322 RepID=UPI00156931A1|nr:aldose 1-epimerase [Eubacterium ruminantium]